MPPESPSDVSGAPARAAAPRQVRISELFLSLQGEGPSAGTPAHFLRLQGCDVGCVWCDSKYTWDTAGGRTLGIDEALAELLEMGGAPLLVITGGEPLQHPGVEALVAAALKSWPRVEIETSGLLPPPVRNARLHYNVSPKLPRATPRWAETWRHAAAWIAEPNATFKVVVGDPPDLDDALRLIADHALPRERVMLMPEGLTDEVLRERARDLAEVCKRQGLRLSPRLHVWMWGARRGV
jgi:7-carboxy-7-deazaguanine synthase